MKKTILFTILSILAFSFAAQAQESDRYSSSRLDSLAAELKRSTVDLADRTSEDLLRNNSRNRRDIEAAFLAQQLDASAGLFQQMTRNGSNRAAELRDAAAILSDLARRAPNSGSNNNLWRNAQNAINDINRELGSSGGGNNGGGNNGGGARVGSVLWRGTVDDRVQLVIRGGNLSVETISGRAYPEGNFSFTSSLPRRNVNAEVTKKSGRGEARVVQQPSRDNDYTTIVEILDSGSGAREYQLEISWR
ncbi:MAG: hypothetical protein ACR2MG_03865 [Pyrinomonadaceae bacterium]